MSQNSMTDSVSVNQDQASKSEKRGRRKELPEDVAWILDLEVIKKPEKLRAARVLAIIARFQPIYYNNIWRLSGLPKSTFSKILKGLREDLDYTEDKTSSLRFKPVLYRLRDDKRTAAINKMGDVIKAFEYVLSKIEKIAETKSSAIQYPQVGFYMYLIDLYITMIAAQKIIDVVDDSNPERQCVYDNLFLFGVKHATYILTKIREKMSKVDFDRAVDYHMELLNVYYADKFLHEFAVLLKSALEVDQDEQLTKTFYGHVARAIMQGTSSSFIGEDEDINIRQAIKALEKDSEQLRIRRFRFEKKNLNKQISHLQKIRFARHV